MLESKERQVGLDGFVETSDRDAILRYGCDTELCKVDRLKDQLEKVSRAVSSKLLSLQIFTSQPLFRRKRPAPTDEPCSSRSVDSERVEGATLTNKPTSSALLSLPVEVSSQSSSMH